VVSQPLLTKETREPSVDAPKSIYDSDEPDMKYAKRDPKSSATEPEGDDFISFAIKGKDPRFGFKYGMDPRNNPIMCTVFIFSFISAVIAVTLLLLPQRTQVMFIFGILFAVVAGLFCIITTFLTSLWRRIRF